MDSIITNLFTLDFGQILEKSSLLCLECVLILIFQSSLQTSRWEQNNDKEFEIIQFLSLSGCPSLSSLCNEGLSDPVEEASQEWSSNIHLHR